VDWNDIRVMELALDELRETNDALGEIDAGICLLHLDACIASMESRLIKARTGLPPSIGRRASPPPALS
jgi:hypothetical protein